MSHLSPAANLLITRNLPPIQGGMERLMYHTALALAGMAPTAVVGPTGCRGPLPPGIDVREAPFGVPWFHLAALAALHGRRWPGLRRVLAGSGLTAPLAESLARRRHLPYGVFVHGLDLVAPYAAYRWGFLPSIRRADLVIANSHATAALARRAGVDAGRLEIVFPGVDLAARALDDDLFRARTGLAGTRFLLSVGRLTERKGLEPLIRQVLPTVLKDRPDVRLVVIGTEPGHATTDSPLAERLRAASAAVGLAERVTLLGRVDDLMLTAAYRAATALVFPVLERPGDLEGFGMVAIEAAAQGCPTLGFAAGGVGDAVADTSGRLAAPGDHAGLRLLLEQLLDTGLPGVDAASCRAHAERFSWTRHQERLAQVFARRARFKDGLA